jgi:heme O synthase-like polyprenyltransferase
MGATSKGDIAYLVLYIASMLSIVPWIYLTWRAIREESRQMMTGVFVFSVIYVAGFTGMLASDTFRQTVIHWSFFA